MAETKDYSAEALLAKEKEVELDTDGLKEEKVEVEDKTEEKKEPNLNLGEVDLEYTDHSKPSDDKKDKPNIEITEDEKKAIIENTKHYQDNWKRYSKSIF